MTSNKRVEVKKPTKDDPLVIDISKDDTRGEFKVKTSGDSSWN